VQNQYFLSNKRNRDYVAFLIDFAWPVKNFKRCATTGLGGNREVRTWVISFMCTGRRPDYGNGEIVAEMRISRGLKAVVTERIGLQSGFSGSSLQVIRHEPDESGKFFKSGKNLLVPLLRSEIDIVHWLSKVTLARVLPLNLEEVLFHG
jgi:hypothetical protein